VLGNAFRGENIDLWLLRSVGKEGQREYQNTLQLNGVNSKDPRKGQEVKKRNGLIFNQRHEREEGERRIS